MPKCDFKKVASQRKSEYKRVKSKQNKGIRKLKFYFQGRAIEIVKQYIYLGFSFIPSGKYTKEFKI